MWKALANTHSTQSLHSLGKELAKSMETSQPLSIESFSYSWLVNLKPSLEGLDSSLRASLDASDEASFIEMDPRMPPSKRFLIRNSQDFKFDFPTSKSPLNVLHADELFSNGYVMPLIVDQLKILPYEDSDSISQLRTSSHAAKTVVSDSKKRCASLRCRRLSKQLFQKYLDFLRPLYQRIRGQRPTSRRNVGSDTRVPVPKKRIYSAETSPRISVAYSVDDWRKSCDSESSIYEAVLHCKRSIGNN